MISVLDVLVVEYIRYQRNGEQDVFNAESRYNGRNEDCKDIRAKCGGRCKDDIAEKGSIGGGFKMAGTPKSGSLSF